MKCVVCNCFCNENKDYYFSPNDSYIVEYVCPNNCIEMQLNIEYISNKITFYSYIFKDNKCLVAHDKFRSTNASWTFVCPTTNSPIGKGEYPENDEFVIPTITNEFFEKLRHKLEKFNNFK